MWINYYWRLVKIIDMNSSIELLFEDKVTFPFFCVLSLNSFELLWLDFLLHMAVFTNVIFLKRPLKKVVIRKIYWIILRSDVFFLFEMRFGSKVVGKLPLISEVKRQGVLRDLLVLVYNCFQNGHFVVLSLVVIIVLVADVYEEHVTVAVRSQSDPIDIT